MTLPPVIRLSGHNPSALAVTEGDAPVLFFQNALRGERGALHVVGQIAARLFTGADGLRVAEELWCQGNEAPPLAPPSGRGTEKGGGLTQGGGSKTHLALG
jgi:hypothetical protein